MDAVWDIKSIPQWASALMTTIFVCSNVAMSLVVTDLGQVLHMIGGTAARWVHKPVLVTVLAAEYTDKGFPEAHH